MQRNLHFESWWWKVGIYSLQCLNFMSKPLCVVYNAAQGLKMDILDNCSLFTNAKLILLNLDVSPPWIQSSLSPIHCDFCHDIYEWRRKGTVLVKRSNYVDSNRNIWPSWMDPVPMQPQDESAQWSDFLDNYLFHKTSNTISHIAKLTLCGSSILNIYIKS